MNKGFKLAALLCVALFMQPVLAACNDIIPATTPVSDFIDNDDGTVTHVVTGLIWMRCGLGQSWDGTNCTGEVDTFNWQGALQASHEFSYAGFSDWRLPNKNELLSIVEERCSQPSINSILFPQTVSSTIRGYWTSTPYSSARLRAWRVFFYSGAVVAGTKSNHHAVRLVRNVE